MKISWHDFLHSFQSIDRQAVLGIVIAFVAWRVRQRARRMNNNYSIKKKSCTISSYIELVNWLEKKIQKFIFLFIITIIYMIYLYFYCLTTCFAHSPLISSSLYTFFHSLPQTLFWSDFIILFYLSS